jgi:predicted Fe-Mo cluster-binding NifX family protein
MKAAITSTGQELSSLVDCEFERSLFFMIIDVATMRVEAVANPHVDAMSGAGIQSAQFIANNAVEIVFTGDCGSNAFETLKAAGVQVVKGITGTVGETLKKLRSGKYHVTGESGTNAQLDAGGDGDSGDDVPKVGFDKDSVEEKEIELSHRTTMFQSDYGMSQSRQELQLLKQQADSIKHQIDAINKRISEIEKNISVHDDVKERAV